VRNYLLAAAMLLVGAVLVAASLGAPVPVVTEPTMERRLYLKLPLEQPRFHWRFADPGTFLAGELTLRLHRKGLEPVETVIFRDGTVGRGWRPMSETDERGFYFGFVSTERWRTGPGGHRVELELVLPADAPGIGAFRAGTLPAGRYTAVGHFDGFSGGWLDEVLWDEDEPTAFVEWEESWPLVITADEGWHGSTSEEP
jgi:hypothetical protein